MGDNGSGPDGRRRVVVTGLGMVSPLGNSAEDSWNALVAGESGAGPITQFDTAGLLSTLHPGADASRDGTTAVAGEVDVRVERLTDLLDAHGVPADFAFLSVDTEGHDLHVLRGLDFTRYRPHLVLTETDDVTEPEKRALLTANGYRLATEVGVNTLWLRD